MASPHELKNLETRHRLAVENRIRCREEVRIAQKKEVAAHKLVKEIEEKIAQCVQKKPVVSEHALLRYFERVLGYDLQVIAEELLTDQAVAVITSIPQGKVPSVGCRLVFKNNTVVTLET